VDTDLSEASFDADFDGDGSTDRAVVLTRDEGPVKAHYLAVLRNTGSSVEPVTVLLGKNVLVEGLSGNAKEGVIVRLLTRAEGQSEDEAPTVPQVRAFRVDGGKLNGAK
jgi:hypothetical protein